MDYEQLDIENFKINLTFFNEKLSGEPAKRAYISVGSNLFINFGEVFDSPFPNGKPYKASPWTIWLGANVDWRLSQNGKFVVGSCQDYDKMNVEVQKLVGKKFISSSIISQLMDIQFEFEDGYQLTSFLSVIINEQWTLFCSNQNVVGLKSETLEEVKQIQKLSSHFEVKDIYEDIVLPINQKQVVDCIVDRRELYLNFDNHLSLYLDGCTWRIEKNGEYCIGVGDYNLDESLDIQKYLNEIKGSRLIRSSITQPFQDARFEFENGYVITTFSSYDEVEPWRILKDDQNIYSAIISLA